MSRRARPRWRRSPRVGGESIDISPARRAMSTIHSSPAFDRIRPNRAHRLLQRLAALLVLDEARRRPPAVSLPGRAADTDPGLAQPSPPAVERVQCEPHLECNGRVCWCESEPDDGKGPLQPRPAFANERALRPTS